MTRLGVLHGQRRSSTNAVLVYTLEGRSGTPLDITVFIRTVKSSYPYISLSINVQFVDTKYVLLVDKRICGYITTNTNAIPEQHFDKDN